MSDLHSRIVLIRHGQSASNAGSWISDVETCGGLTDQGRDEATRLRQRLARLPDLAPDNVFVSTMRRAVETAAIVAEPTGLAAEQIVDLGERRPGEAAGLTVPEYEQRYGHRPWEDWFAPLSPGGEDYQSFYDRVSRVMTGIADAGAGVTSWVVCHGFFMWTTAHWFAGGAADEVPSFGHIANTGMCEWVQMADGAPWILQRYNDHAHLENPGHLEPT